MALLPYCRRALAPCVAACLLAQAGTVAAQAAPATPARLPDPTDARQPVPPLVHRSALAPASAAALDSPPVAWPAANAQVGRIGGWRAYAREAGAGPASAPTPATAPATGAHGHHHHPPAGGRP